MSRGVLHAMVLGLVSFCFPCVLLLQYLGEVRDILPYGGHEAEKGSR